jgi:hypothetical protein
MSGGYIKGERCKWHVIYHYVIDIANQWILDISISLSLILIAFGVFNENLTTSHHLYMMNVLKRPLESLLINVLGSCKLEWLFLLIVRKERTHIFLIFFKCDSSYSDDTLESYEFLIDRHYWRRGFLYNRNRHLIWDWQWKWERVLSLIELVNSNLYKASNLLLSVHVRHYERVISAFNWEEQVEAGYNIAVNRWDVAVAELLIVALLDFDSNWNQLIEIHTSYHKVILGARLKFSWRF